MKIWIDDVRPAPHGNYMWCRSVNQAKQIINDIIKFPLEDWIELIDIDHDAGDYASDGGDFINILNWFEETNQNYPIRIHSMNPVGKENMRRIIKRNGWTEVL